MIAWATTAFLFEVLHIASSELFLNMGAKTGATESHLRRIRARLKTARWSGYMLLLLIPWVYAYPPVLGETVPHPVVVFEGDKMVYKKWGTWHWPWGGGKEWTRFQSCRQVGFSRGPGFAVGETSMILQEDGKVRVEKLQAKLCVYKPEVFFAERSRRRPNSPEAATAWATADHLALDAFFSPEMIGLRRLQLGDPKVADRHLALLSRLSDMGFAVVVNSVSY